MKKFNQAGFSAVEVLLVIVLVAIIGGTGYYVYHASNKSNDVINQANVTSQSSTGPIIKSSDREAITAAVKAYPVATGSANPDIVKLSELVGNNAKGTFGYTKGGGGGTFIANKSDGKWSVIFEGQQLPGKDLGAKYKLPKGWYSSQY